MGEELRMRGGALLLQRRGGLNFLKQDMWDRAPEPRGLWAFPWPYDDLFFSYHQISRHFPKALKDEETSFDSEAEEERLRWRRKHEKRVAPLRRFWWEGSLYSHITKSGEVLSLEEWTVLSVEGFKKAFERGRGTRVLKPRDGEEWRHGERYSVDFTEVFLSPKLGRLRG